MRQKTQDLGSKCRWSRRLNIVLGAVSVFLAVVVAAQLFPGQTPTTAAPGESSGSAAEQSTGGGGDMEFVRRDPDDPMAIGDVNAPVVLTEWVDMRCPFCALYSRDTLPILIEEYVDTGQVRVEFHDVVFYGEHSENAAIAARAAGKQDMYVEYLTTVYAAAPESGHPDMPRDMLIDFAEQAGVPDMEQFVADLDDAQLLQDVHASTQQAQQLGVTAVPFFVAGNTALSGAQPVDVFREFLDQALTGTE
ncbi:thioredoxin domain-containing protein [Leucobacter sp. UT-8R-CII-1-4]|uniref:DsbA family protein n=1 Tax=Leucobacter sp. UT-8R-CII-1-4 TaxID=3040075 RepID=UPI0024A99EC7|nr:thioredoxin domain-containing protein [Leucobacter sp. UT-8R-CII-1-4]MDI6024087.1 thioredoxin domain-containing protein [Leucobacter sp. UT-8R-CII-1-4]